MMLDAKWLKIRKRYQGQLEITRGSNFSLKKQQEKDEQEKRDDTCKYHPLKLTGASIL